MPNFTIANLDTDSIMICKPDQSPFSEEERTDFLQQLNDLFPPKISWADDGYFERAIIFKTKNYVLWDGLKQKLKGSAVKAPAKEKAIREFVQETIKAILDGKTNYTEIYQRYVTEALKVTDISRWSTRKTLTATTFASERANETKIIDAIQGSEYQEGNRIWVYFTKEGTLKLAERFEGDHDPIVLVKKLYMTSKLFDTVLPTKDLYLNYALKKNQKLLDSLEISCPGWREVKAKYPDLFNKTYYLPNLLPQKEYTFRCFKYFKPKDCKVIIIGQDPYPNPEHACGLAFSSPSNKIPGSLQNIFKELDANLTGNKEPTMPNTGDLESWAKQGVLLINSILSTTEGNSLTHANVGWEQYTTNKIQQIINCGQPLVILAWGKFAQDKLKDLKCHNNVISISGAHPSPLARGAFFGGKYFSRANSFLKNKGVEPIDWKL